MPHEMVRIDETQEAIARIRMAIDNDSKARADQCQPDFQSDNGPKIKSPSELSNLERDWSFGSPSGGQSTSRDLEKTLAPTDRDYFTFDERLRSFITYHFPEEAPRYEDLIYVRFYFSLEDRT